MVHSPRLFADRIPVPKQVIQCESYNTGNPADRQDRHARLSGAPSCSAIRCWEIFCRKIRSPSRCRRVAVGKFHAHGYATLRRLPAAMAKAVIAAGAPRSSVS
jgi:hypothetical protein